MTVQQRPTTEAVGTAPDGFSYVPDFLTEAEATELLSRLSALKDEQKFEHEIYRGKPMKRGYVQYGYSYVTQGRRLKTAPPMPDYVAGLMNRCLTHCPEGTR